MARQEPLGAWHGSAVLMLALALAGCSAGHEQAEVPGADQPYPNLATVPERPTPGLNHRQGQAMINELVADRAAARRTDEALRAATEQK